MVPPSAQLLNEAPSHILRFSVIAFKGGLQYRAHLGQPVSEGPRVRHLLHEQLERLDGIKWQIGRYACQALHDRIIHVDMVALSQHTLKMAQRPLLVEAAGPV